MLTEYEISQTKAEAAAILPVWDYIAQEMLTATDFEQIAVKFAAYWRNRIAYAYRVPRVSTIQFEVKHDTWQVIDAAAESLETGAWYEVINDQPHTVTLAPNEREIVRGIRWAIHRQVTDNRQHLKPGYYKQMLKPAQ